MEGERREEKNGVNADLSTPCAAPDRAATCRAALGGAAPADAQPRRRQPAANDPFVPLDTTARVGDSLCRTRCRWCRDGCQVPRPGMGTLLHVVLVQRDIFPFASAYNVLCVCMNVCVALSITEHRCLSWCPVMHRRTNRTRRVQRAK